MQRTNAILAITMSLFLGTTAATFLPGCQPAKPGVGGTTDGDAKPIEAPSIDVPDTKPEPPMPTDKPLDPVDAAPPKPASDPAAPQEELKKEEEKKAEEKNAEQKNEAKPDQVVALNGSGRPIIRAGEFDGVKRDGTPDGLLFPASMVIVDGWMYVANLALPLTPMVGDEPEEDVTRWTVSRFRVPR